MLTSPLKESLKFGDKFWIVLPMHAPPGEMFDVNPDDIHQVVFLGRRDPGKNDCGAESILMIGLEDGCAHHCKEKRCFNTRTAACHAVIAAIGEERERLLERQRLFEDEAAR